MGKDDYVAIVLGMGSVLMIVWMFLSDSVTPFIIGLFVVFLQVVAFRTVIDSSHWQCGHCGTNVLISHRNRRKGGVLGISMWQCSLCGLAVCDTCKRELEHESCQFSQ